MVEAMWARMFFVSGFFITCCSEGYFFLDKAFCRFACRCVFNLEIMIISLLAIEFFRRKKFFFDMHALPI